LAGLLQSRNFEKLLMGKKGFKEMQVTTTLKKLKFNLRIFLEELYYDLLSNSMYGSVVLYSMKKVITLAMHNQNPVRLYW
jgi:hypothetical protein